MPTRTHLLFLMLAVPTSAIAGEPPLPEGAIARLGSAEWRNLTNTTVNSQLGFTSDSRGVITADSELIRVIDFETGKERCRIDDFKGDASFALLPDDRLLLRERTSLRT